MYESIEYLLLKNKILGVTVGIRIVYNLQNVFDIILVFQKIKKDT